MATTKAIDKPGHLYQRPQYMQYEKSNPPASPSDSTSPKTSDLGPSKDSILKHPKRHNGADSVHTMSTAAANIKCKHNTPNSSLPPPSRGPGQPFVTDMPDNTKNKSMQSIFSRMSSKLCSISKNISNSIIPDNGGQQNSQPNARRLSLQPQKLLPTCSREICCTSTLHRSRVIDKRGIPIIFRESAPSKKPSLATLFFNLPAELQLEIVTKLIYSDIVALRKSSRAFNNLLMDHEHDIARRQIQLFVEPRYTTLYPPETPNKPTFEYLSKLATKSIAASELSRLLATQLYDDFHHKYFEPHQDEARSSIIQYMGDRLRFPLMIIQHFLEQFAERKLWRDKVNGYASRADDIQLQEAIMEKHYTMDQLTEASDFYRLTLYLLWQNVALGADEKIKRIWAIVTDTLPAVQDLTKFMIVGGLPELLNIYRKPKPSSKRKAMARFSAIYKNERTRKGSKLGAALLPRVHHTPENIKRYSKLAISPNIFHLWIHPAQNVLFRKEMIEGLNHFRCIDEIVELLLDGWEEWAFEDADSDAEEED